MIVGFDPGTVSALAVLDIGGNVLFTKSFRGGYKEAVKLLSDFRPSIIASDKTSSPAVKKLASSFGALAVFPDHNLTLREKAQAIKKYGLKSQHDKDALAAAIFAYKKYKRLAAKVIRKEDEIFKALVRGDIANVSQVLKTKQKNQRKPKKRDVDLSRRVKHLENKIAVLEEVLSNEKAEKALLKKNLSSKKPIKMIKVSGDLKSERNARNRLERELLEAHGRISKIEARIDGLKRKPKEQENIRQLILRMIEGYKERFRK